MQGWFRAGYDTWGIQVLMIGLTAGLGGCGTDSLAPPPPEGLRNVLKPAQPQGSTTKAQIGARPIELILAPRDGDAAGASAHFARTQAGFDGVLVNPVVSNENVTPAGQADLVAKAIKEKPPVLVIELPEKPDPRLAKLTEDARGQGIPVVLIGPPLDGTAGGDSSKESAAQKAPLIRVTSAPFEPTAKQVVQSALRVLKNARIDPKGGAILFFSPTADPYTTARVSAIRAALTEAGITAQTSVILDTKSSEGINDLKAAIEKNPKATLILPFDFRTYSALSTIIAALPESRTLVTAGYNSEERSPFIPQIPNMAAVAEFRPAKLIRRAVTVAKSLLRGDKVEPINEVSINFTDSLPSTGVPELRPKKPPKSDVPESPEPSEKE